MKAARAVLFLAAVCAALPLVLTAQADSSVETGEARLELAHVLFAEGRYHEAAEAYEGAREGLEPSRQLRATEGLVRSLLRVAEFTRARDEAHLLAERVSDDAELMAVYGDALWAAGLFDEADRAYRDAAALDPGAARARHGLARVLAAKNQLEPAMEEAQAAIERDPGEAEFHHMAGSIYMRLHQFEEAAAAFAAYVDRLPDPEGSDQAIWARSQIRFLQSFGRRTPYQIRDDGATRLHTVEFRLVRDKVVVRGRINGSQPMDFVVDTGSDHTIISRRAAQRLGVPGITQTLSAGVGAVGLRGLEIGRVDSLEIGSLRVDNVPVLIKNPPLTGLGLPTRAEETFSPLSLGLSVIIDYERRRLTIGRQMPDEPADHEMPLWMHRLAMVRGTLDGEHPANFIVDTGGEVISISTSTASQLAVRPELRRVPLRVYGISGWDPDAFLLPGVHLEIDTIRYDNFPMVVLNLRAPSALLGFEVGGILGHRFLSPYRVTIDLHRAVVRLARS